MTQLFSKVMAPWILGMWERAEKAWFIFFNNLFSLYNLKLIIEAEHQCLNQDPSGLGYFFESKIDPLLILSLGGSFSPTSWSVNAKDEHLTDSWDFCW